MDFVSFEIAKKLKEKGFREKCFATYTPYGGILEFNEIDTDKIAHCDLNIKDFGKLYNYYKDSNIDAPTISQVLKWLREEKKILVTILPQEKNLGHDTLCFAVYKITEDLYQHIYNGTVNTLVDSYEELSIAGIEYVLDNLI